MNTVAIWIKSGAENQLHMITFKELQDFEQLLVERVYESPCHWDEFQVAALDELLKEDVESVIKELIEDCRKDNGEDE